MLEKFKLHNRVVMLGFLPHNKVRETLVQGQIFLNTSLTEAFCMSIVEAASCGLHVVSTNVGGIPEVLPKKFMTLAEPNPAEISGAVLEAIKWRETNQLVNPIEKHNDVSLMYHWSDIAERTDLVYKLVMESPVVSISTRLNNFISAGFFFGLIWAWATIINILSLTFLDFVDARKKYYPVKENRPKKRG
uniref:Glycosyl transferase family 1 domain-containing protein n=1 Tax=Ditylenchus dipsaci TaxID=166011 RepID=A0A915DMI9_9BILA